MSMLKQLLRPISYLLISLLIGTIATLVWDSYENIAVEKKIRSELKKEIEDAADSFKQFSRTPTPNEVVLFLKQFSASTALSSKIIAVSPDRDTKPEDKDFSFLFTYKEGGAQLDYYIVNRFLQAELDILETPELVFGVFITIVVFTFIVLYTEKRKQAKAMQQQFDAEKAELKQVLAEHEAQSLLGRMVSTLAHELKTPIATISNLVQTLPERIRDETFTDRFIMLTREELNRTQQLINNLLAYGKEIAIRNEEWVDLAGLVAGQAVKNNMQLYLPVSVKVYGDVFYLGLLFENLLRNSHVAGADKVHVKIGADQTGNVLRATVSVEDNGRGFPIGVDIDTLLNPFITFQSRGAGLGLYLADKIAAAHDGKISLYRLERGAGVSISLPRERVMTHG